MVFQWITSVDPVRPVMSLCSLLSFNSHRRVVIPSPAFPISQFAPEFDIWKIYKLSKKCWEGIPSWKHYSAAPQWVPTLIPSDCPKPFLPYPTKPALSPTSFKIQRYTLPTHKTSILSGLTLGFRIFTLIK